MKTPSLTEGIEIIHKESEGALAIVVVRQGDVLNLLEEAVAGNAEAAMVFQAVSQNCGRIASAPRDKPMLCVNCPCPVRLGSNFAMVVAFPFRENPSMALGLAVCRTCDDGGDLAEITTKALCEIWPDGRVARVTEPRGGHA